MSNRAESNYNRAHALAQTLAHPLRRVVVRAGALPHYQDETLECGHVLKQQSPTWKSGRFGTGGAWCWPARRRCGKCPEETR